MSFLSILMYNARFSSDKERHTGEDCTLEGEEGELSDGRLTGNSQNLKKNVWVPQLWRVLLIFKNEFADPFLHHLSFII